MQRVQVTAVGKLPGDVLVDLVRRHAARVASAHDDGLVGPCLRRLVALERDADELVAEIEGVDDLGSRRQ